MKPKNDNIRKVFKVHKDSNALRVTIPESMCFKMGIEQGDMVWFDYDYQNNLVKIYKIERRKKQDGTHRTV